MHFASVFSLWFVHSVVEVYAFPVDDASSSYKKCAVNTNANLTTTTILSSTHATLTDAVMPGTSTITTSAPSSATQPSYSTKSTSNTITIAPNSLNITSLLSTNKEIAFAGTTPDISTVPNATPATIVKTTPAPFVSQPVVTPRITPVTTFPPSSTYIQAIIDLHNVARDATGASPSLAHLVWDDNLASLSLTWSQHLANDIGFLQHSTDEYGENLESQQDTAGDETLGAKATQLWYNEKEEYLKEGSPKIGGGNFEMYGHYTQMVWRGTKKVGCASYAKVGTNNYFTTCKYSPAGNVMGGSPF